MVQKVRRIRIRHSLKKRFSYERLKIPATITPAMSAARMVNGASGDFAGVVSRAGAGVTPSVTSAAGGADPCTCVVTVVTACVPPGAATDITVL